MKLLNNIIALSFIILIQNIFAQEVIISNKKSAEKDLSYNKFLFINEGFIYHISYYNNDFIEIIANHESNTQSKKVSFSNDEFKKALNLDQTVHFFIIEYFKDSLSIVFSGLSKDESQNFLYLYRLSGKDINNFANGDLRQITEVDLPKKDEYKQHQEFKVVLSNDSSKVMFAIAPEIENKNKFDIHYGICDLDGNNHYQNEFFSDNSSFYNPTEGNKKSLSYTGKDRMSISKLFVGDHGTVICFLELKKGYSTEGTISYVFNPQNMKTSVLPLNQEKKEKISDISFFQLPNKKILITTYRFSFNKEGNEKLTKVGVYGSIIDETEFELSNLEPAFLSRKSITDLDQYYNPEKNSFPNEYLVGGVSFNAPILHNNEIYFIGQSSHYVSSNNSITYYYSGIVVFKFNIEAERYEYFGGDYNNQVTNRSTSAYKQFFTYTPKILDNKLFLFMNDNDDNTDLKSGKIFSYSTKKSHYKVVRFDDVGNKKVYRFSPIKNKSDNNPFLSIPSAYFDKGSLVFYGINTKAKKTYKVTFDLDKIL